MEKQGTTILSLTNYNVQELNDSELTSIVGGGWWSDFKTGFVEGFEWMKAFVIEVFSSKKPKV